MQNSYTSGAKIGAPCRCRPGARGLEDRRARCYTNDANESGGCVRYRAAVCGSCRYAVSAPRLKVCASAQGILAYRARALLLSYGGMKNGRPTR